ncbi:hypothetical protein [Variovorax boronicumulans]|uniref:hypothetical protein n=1 Tax=Variovorax boronicumulans TaxID=436515 RepID=UPI001112D288|nr:hypothetical protein [Variovorax boronicumulans]
MDLLVFGRSNALKIDASIFFAMPPWEFFTALALLFQFKARRNQGVSVGDGFGARKRMRWQIF